MRLIAVASAKSSPGASIAAELIARLWPTPGRRVLVDGDPAGSAWALRPGVAPNPGLVALAATARRGLDPQMILDHLQPVGGLDLLVGGAGARQAGAALESLGPDLGPRLRDLAGAVDVVVADCGRLGTGSSSVALCRAAHRVVLVCRPTATEVIHVAPWLDDLGNAGCDLAVLLVDAGQECPDSTYRPGEVDDALGVPVIGTLAHDPKRVARLHRRPADPLAGDRSRLVRTAREAAVALATLTGPEAAPRPEPRTLAATVRSHP